MNLEPEIWRDQEEDEHRIDNAFKNWGWANWLTEFGTDTRNLATGSWRPPSPWRNRPFRSGSNYRRSPSDKQPAQRGPVLLNSSLERLRLGSRHTWIIRMGFFPGDADLVGWIGRFVISQRVWRVSEGHWKLYSHESKISFKEVLGDGASMKGNLLSARYVKITIK